MAQARELLNRIRSIESTRKITRTMELVATSKLKKAQDRIHATVPYAQKLNEMMRSLSSVPKEKRSSLMGGSGGPVKRTALFLVTANRGLCGAYNTNILRKANAFLAEEKAAGREVDLYVSGKKGIGFFRFRKIEMKETYLHLSEVVSFAEADEVTTEFIDQFEKNTIQRMVIIFYHFQAAGRQVPELWQILPIEGDVASSGADESSSGPVAATDFIFDPDAVSILQEIVPLSVKVKVLRALVEAQASEQSARRVAMKVATDNAGEIISDLRRTYNRARQAAITQELAEIMGGVEALKG